MLLIGKDMQFDYWRDLNGLVHRSPKKFWIDERDGRDTNPIDGIWDSDYRYFYNNISELDNFVPSPKKPAAK